ncbi:hypothetical protein OBRU01_04590 [Operophtera brumata]|uniref:Hemolymph juvenile hormone binding protein n=1 Tax=Operophtera brumata TaxID=104452 RepID=A0A0L7LNY0_OPEBR|nr:hypothetical protein OBRU01_04590 [Operophtera brumata]
MQTLIALSLLIVGITSLPQRQIIAGINLHNERLVTGSIVEAIEDASQAIKDAGLDPLYVEKEATEYALPVPVLFNLSGDLEEFLFTGLSNIVVHNINYSIITNRLTFDIRLPLIELSLGKAVKDVTVFGSRVESYASGRLAVVGIRLTGNVRVSIGIITGISIRSIDLDFSLGGIESELKIMTHGKDFSEPINRFLGEIIPGVLTEYSKEINELLEIVAKDVIEANL